MDPFKRLWMFENWVADQTETAELAKNHAYLLGSFWNPEAVKNLLGESGNVHESSEADLAKSMEMVKNTNDNKAFNKGKKKRKRRKIKG